MSEAPALTAILKRGPPSAARLLSAFLEGRNPNTMKTYSRSVEDFRAFLGVGSVGEAAEVFLGAGHGEANALALEYRVHLSKRGLSAASINVRLSGLRSLVKLARVMGIVPWALEVPAVKAQAYRDTRGPGRAGFVALLAQLEKRTDPKGLRDVAMLRLLYERALRESEVVGLDLADVNFERNAVNVLGKGRTQKELLTVAPTTMAAIRAWVAVRGTHSGPLFCNLSKNTGHCGVGRLSRQGIYRMVRLLGDAVGVRARPHGLRHAAITEALDRGMDVRTVQRFSRHRSLATLLIYDDNRRDLAGDVARALSEPAVTSVVTSNNRSGTRQRKRAAGEPPNRP